MRTLLKILIPLLIIAVGAFGMRTMILSKKAPPKTPKVNNGALVEVMTIARQDRQVLVSGTGTVQARREVSVIPQVSGKVVEISPHLVAGGFFRKGDLLFAIEEADYRLAVDRARATLAQAEVNLATMQSQAEVARLEWQRLGLGDKEKPNPLVLYEPQMKSAEAAIASARATLEQARLDLRRTRVHAPFNSRVSSEQVEFGQYLRAGTTAAMLTGTDRAEVVVPLPVEDLAAITVPGPRSEGRGSKATVRFTNGADTVEWPGRVDRTLSDVDPLGRMVRVVVAVDDPYSLNDENAGARLPLQVGMFVDVELAGETLKGVWVLPSKALRDGSTAWVADSDNRLRIAEVTVVRHEKEQVLVSGGLADGDRVVLTYISGAADGTKLRLLPESEAP